MIRIATGLLVGLLEDLLPTASPADGASETAGVLLWTARGYRDPFEPGRSDILCGFSTTRYSIGHTHAVCDGTLDEPMLWHRTDVASVIAVFKPMVTDDHVVEIKHYGDTVIVQEQEDLFGSRSHFEFKSRSTEKFPRDMIRLLEPPHGEIGLLARPTPRVDFTPSILDPFIKIAKRHKEILQTYRYPGVNRILIQIGERYRGLVVPVTLDDEVDQDPSSTVYPYTLPLVVDDPVTEKVMDAARVKEDPLPLPDDDIDKKAEPVS